MKINVINVLDDCPEICCDAKIAVDWDVNTTAPERVNGVSVIIDCDHSGVCTKKGDNRDKA